MNNNKSGIFVYSNGDRIHYKDDQKHRVDGPAVENSISGNKEWWCKGTKISCSSQKEFESYIKNIAFW